MTEIELLSWARGPGLQIATIVFVAGVVIRVFEILVLGRKTNLAEAKGPEMSIIIQPRSILQAEKIGL